MIAKVPAARYLRRAFILRQLYPHGAIVVLVGEMITDTRPALPGETDLYEDVLDVMARADGYLSEADRVEKERTYSLRGKWAHNYHKCVRCGTTAIPHKAKGLCRDCYDSTRR